MTTAIVNADYLKLIKKVTNEENSCWICNKHNPVLCDEALFYDTNLENYKVSIQLSNNKTRYHLSIIKEYDDDLDSFDYNCNSVLQCFMIINLLIDTSKYNINSQNRLVKLSQKQLNSPYWKLENGVVSFNDQYYSNLVEQIDIETSNVNKYYLRNKYHEFVFPNKFVSGTNLQNYWVYIGRDNVKHEYFVKIYNNFVNTKLPPKLHNIYRPEYSLYCPTIVKCITYIASFMNDSKFTTDRYGGLVRIRNTHNKIFY